MILIEFIDRYPVDSLARAPGSKSKVQGARLQILFIFLAPRSSIGDFERPPEFSATQTPGEFELSE